MISQTLLFLRMRTHPLILAFATLYCFLVLARAEIPGDSRDAASLREIKEALWPKAYREQDTALLDQLLAKKFQLIDAEGNRSTKQEELDYIRTRESSVSRWDRGFDHLLG